MPVVSPLRLPASQAMDDLTLKHWSEFTALFASLSAEMQADLWAKGTTLSLPDFPTPELIAGYWGATHDAWALVQRYPGAVAVGPLLNDIMGSWMTDLRLPERRVKQLNMGISQMGTMVVDDSLDWVPWVYGMAKWVVAGAQPRKLVLDARRWGKELTCEAVGRVKDLPVKDKGGAKLHTKVDVLVGSLYEKEAAEQCARENGVEGSVEIVLMWDVEVWKALGEM